MHKTRYKKLFIKVKDLFHASNLLDIWCQQKYVYKPTGHYHIDQLVGGVVNITLATFTFPGNCSIETMYCHHHPHAGHHY